MFAERIFLNIEPFLGVVLAITKAVMPATRLKFPLHSLVLQCEFALPIGNPLLDGESQIVRRAKAMKVIWHQQIITDEPRFRFRPRLMQKPMCRLVGKPGIALVSIYGEQNDIGPTEIDVNAVRWILPSREFGVRRGIHKSEITQTQILLKSLGLSSARQ